MTSESFGFCLVESTSLYYVSDDTTFHACDKDLNSHDNRLQHDGYLEIDWFENDYMKLNRDKCLLLVMGINWVSNVYDSEKQKLL